MGTDNLHKKRKAKTAHALSRRRAKHSSYKKILIVCEGEKTEPNYFEELKRQLSLNSANIIITGQSGSSPSAILRFARARYSSEKELGDPYDKVYCVFDKDSHDSYESTCQEILRIKPKDTYYAITSVPSFEYWLLLHFKYSCSPYNHLPKNSAANQVLIDLKKHYPEYAKGRPNVFGTLRYKLDSAKENASKSLKAAREIQTDNPSTRVHELVDFLQMLKSQCLLSTKN